MRRFTDADPSEFELRPDADWAALSEDERVNYNETRIAHHAELVVVTTFTIAEITNEGRLLTLMNQRENGARRGLIVSGAAATGKTTAIKQLGRFHELRTRRRFPSPGPDDRIPVVYVTAPPKGSPRKLAMEFARFLGLPPVSSRANATDIADAVCQILIDARCDIVIVDSRRVASGQGWWARRGPYDIGGAASADTRGPYPLGSASGTVRPSLIETRRFPSSFSAPC